MFHYTVKTDKSIEGAVQSVEQSLKKHKYRFYHKVDIISKQDWSMIRNWVKFIKTLKIHGLRHE